MLSSKSRRPVVRYAVVGLGHIAQQAVLPAFAHANSTSQLTALVSSDPRKLQELGDKYNVDHLFSYEQYETCLREGVVDAVYLALPTICTASLPFKLPKPAFMFCARSLWRPPKQNASRCSTLLRQVRSGS